MPRLIMAGDGDSAIAPWGAAEVTPIPAAQSLGEIFMELREPVWRYLLALGLAASEAEEVVQETFLRLCQHLASNGKQANLRGWVFRVAHNLARDEHRRRQRRPSEPLAGVEANGRAYTDSLATPEQQVIDQERVVRLKAALERLPARSGSACICARKDCAIARSPKYSARACPLLQTGCNRV
jgi:RNA polymerase sigma factor (sigma-70 family)